MYSIRRFGTGDLQCNPAAYGCGKFLLKRTDLFNIRNSYIEIVPKLKPMAKLFQKIGVFYGLSPVSFASGFKKLLVKLKEPSPGSHVAAVLCHQISLLLGGSACVAFPSDDLSILVVFESGEKSEIASLIQREKKQLEYLCSSASGSKQEISIDMEDDEISTGLVLREAIHRALISALINQGWTSMQDNVLVFGNVACYQEGTPLETISVDVQLESNNYIVLLLSPDVACFHLAKQPVKIMPQIWEKQFEDGKSVSIEEYGWQCEERTISDFQCCVLPSLREGYIVGFSKTLEGTQRPELEIWLNQNGIQLPPEYYYIKIHFASDLNESAWFPSCLVLKKAGLLPVVPSIRCSKILQVVQHFEVSVAALDFFNAGKIEFQAFPSTGDPSVSDIHSWTTATGLLNSYSGITAPSGLDITLFSSLELKSLQKSLRARPSSQVEAPFQELSQINHETKISIQRDLRPAAVQSEQSLSTRFPRFTRAKPSRGTFSTGASINKASTKSLLLKDASVASSRKSREQLTDCNKENKKLKSTNQLDTVVEAKKQRYASPPKRRVAQIATNIAGTKDDEKSIGASNEHGEKTGRGGASNEHSSSKKKHGTAGNKAAPTPDDTETRVKRKHAEGKLKDLNVADLKNFLRIRKGKLSGKKEELIQRIHELLS